MAFSFEAGLGGRKRDEDEERKNSAAPAQGVVKVNPGAGSGSVSKGESVYNEGGRRVGDLPTVAPKREEEEPLVYDGGGRSEENESPVSYDAGVEEVQAPAVQAPVVTPEPEAKEEKTEAPKKAEEEKPIVYVPPTTNARGTSGAGTNAAGTKGALTGIPEGSENWTPEQWKEYMNQPGNREAMADVTRSTADTARAERNRERAERSGVDRAERNAPQAPRQTVNTAAPAANESPAYAWQGIRANDNAALMKLMGYDLPATGGVPTPTPTPAPTLQREPDSVRFAREAAERRNAPPVPQTTAPRRSGEERAERNAPTGSFQPKVGTQRWYEENGLSWAGQPNRGGTPVTMPDVTADYPGGGGYDAMLEDGIRIRMDRGESRDEAERHTREDIARQNVAAAVEQAGGGTPGVIRYEPTAKTEAERAQEAEAQSILTHTAAGEKNAVQLAQENGVDPSVLTDPGFLRAFKGYKDQGYNNNAAFMTALAGYDAKVQDETRALKNEYVNEAIDKSGVDPREMTREQYDQIEREAEARAEREYTEQTGKRYQEPRRSGEERADQSMSYNPPATPPATGGALATWEDSSPRTSGEPSLNNPNRPGANAEVNSWEGNPQREPDSVRYAREAAERRNAGTQGSSTGATTGNQSYQGEKVGGGSGSGSGTGSDVPKGSTYFTPSYGQDMEKGVKAPYRKGGYTAEEIEKMGNKARSDQKYYNGKKAYEGYYLAPDGKYYPVDQVKANYYRQTGSYAGWDEGMRDYWNTFGTFYGYRPNWRTTGRSGGGGGGYSSSRSYSYSGGGGSRSGGSGGAGGTSNNGYYWNGNTSWSI